MRSMDTTSFLMRQFKSEDGTTLVELMVAISLLVVVLIPAGLFLGNLAHNPANKDKIIAVGMAQSELELLLGEDTPESINETIELNTGWTIERQVTLHEGWVFLKVGVYRRDKALVRLATARLSDE